MKLISEREQIRNVVEDFSAVYSDKTFMIRTKGGEYSVGSILEELSELDLETATAKDVEEIIGNNEWAGKIWCVACLQKKNRGIEFEDFVVVCDECIGKASALLLPVENK